MIALPEDLNEEQEMAINEEFRAWKKVSPHIYDLLISHALEWPSLSFQWSPTPPIPFDDYSLHTCLITANASQKETSYVLQATVKIPIEKEAERQTRSNRKVERDDPPDSIVKSNTPKFEITSRIPHQGEINRARYCPLAANLIATKALSGQVNLFDTNNTPSEGMMKPSVRLIGHNTQGYGLAWNPREKNLILSGANDKRVLMWDINASMTENQRIEPVGSFDFHSAYVEDVAWHQQHRNIFASCSDDRIIAIWDSRFRHCEGRKPVFSILGHTSEIYTLDFSPFNDYLFLSGSDDKNVSLWDMRKLNHSFRNFAAHKESVLKVQWSPFHVGVFASSGQDRKTIIWDMSRCENNKSDHETAVLFTHSGHRSKVPDFDWNQNEKLVIGSVQENNMVHIWELSKSIYYDNEEDSK